jgi:hypothetical protein
LTLEAYSYRVSARFGSRVVVKVSDGVVSLTGPRVGFGPYRIWIGAQAVLLFLAVAGLVAAAALWDWRYLVAGAGLLVGHLAVSGCGAGCMWELMNLVSFGQGAKGESVSFPVSQVRDVRVGAGWARRGMWLLLLPYFKGIDAMAQGVAASFIAPDGTPSGGVYALHMRTPEEAQTLAGLLGGEGADVPEPG